MNLIYKDFAVNIIAFGIYIAAQQFIIFKKISEYGTEIFSYIIILTTLCNVFLYISSGALSNAMLMCNQKYKNNSKISLDFLLYIFLFVFILIFFSSILCFTGIINMDTLLIIPIYSLEIIRVFYSARKRLKYQYTLILSQNILYFIGSIAGYLYFKIDCQNPLFLFLTAEIFSLFIYFFDIKEFVFDFRISKHFKLLTKTYANFSFQTAVNNFVTYFDRILLMPILGSEAVALYYSATVLSKITMLFINPISGVLTSILANTSDDSKKEAFAYLTSRVKQFGVPILVVNLICSYSCLYIVYRQYFDKVFFVVIITSISSVIIIITNLYNMVCMRFVESRKLSYISAFKVLIFLLFGYCLGTYYGLIGYCIGILCSNGLILLVYILIAKKIR